jgi:hypothetical protein
MLCYSSRCSAAFVSSTTVQHRLQLAE